MPQAQLERIVEMHVSQTGKEIGDVMQITPLQVLTFLTKHTFSESFFVRSFEALVHQIGGKIEEVVRIIPPEVLQGMPQAKLFQSHVDADRSKSRPSDQTGDRRGGAYHSSERCLSDPAGTSFQAQFVVECRTLRGWVWERDCRGGANRFSRHERISKWTRGDWALSFPCCGEIMEL